jgi:hypothetical protein
LPDDLLEQLSNYDKPLPELIVSNLNSLNTNFHEFYATRIYNDSEFSDMYDQERVDKLKLGTNKAIEKGYQDVVDFIEEFPEFTPMIAEWDSEEFHT